MASLAVATAVEPNANLARIPNKRRQATGLTRNPDQGHEERNMEPRLRADPTTPTPIDTGTPEPGTGNGRAGPAGGPITTGMAPPYVDPYALDRVKAAGKPDELTIDSATLAARSAADGLADAGAFIALEAWLACTDSRVAAAMAALEQEALQLEQLRGRTDGPDRVAGRKATLIDTVDALRAESPQDIMMGAIQKAAGDLMCNGGRIPSGWEDSVDPNCLQRGAMDGAGLGGNVFFVADDGAPPVEPPVIVNAPRIDFQLAISAAECVEETGPDAFGSDHLIVRGTAQYQGADVPVSNYDRRDFDTGETLIERVELVRVRIAPVFGLTRLSCLFMPVEKEFFGRDNTAKVLTALLDGLVELGASALAGAAQGVPGAGVVLGAILTSDALKNAIKERLRGFSEAIADFLSDDRFTLYTFDANFVWFAPNMLPIVSAEMTATGRDGSRFFSALPSAPVTIPREISAVPTLQQAGAGRRLLSDPGFYRLDHQVRAFLR